MPVAPESQLLRDHSIRGRYTTEFRERERCPKCNSQNLFFEVNAYGKATPMCVSCGWQGPTREPDGHERDGAKRREPSTGKIRL